MDEIKNALKAIFRILTFRATRDEVMAKPLVLLAVGLVLTLIVGIGRWWDDPRDIPIFVRMGLGSVTYVILMATVLTIVSWRVAKEWTGYGPTAGFVAATSVPGIVYALPIEILSPTAVASTYNIAALAFVSAYRVSLLFWFFMRIMGMTVAQAFVCLTLPIMTIAMVLTGVGLGSRILDIMGGFREKLDPTAVEVVISGIATTSCLTVPILFFVHAFMAYARRSSGD